MRSYVGNQTTPAPQRHIIDDEEDDYVEVTGVDEDVEDGWEEVMVVNSPQVNKPTNNVGVFTPITPIAPIAPLAPLVPLTPLTPLVPATTVITNTVSTTTTTNDTTPTTYVITPPTQPIAINFNNITDKVQEVVVSAPSLPVAVPQDPEWLAALKANGKVPYSAAALGDPQYVAPHGMLFYCA